MGSRKSEPSPLISPASLMDGMSAARINKVIQDRVEAMHLLPLFSLEVNTNLVSLRYVSQPTSKDIPVFSFTHAAGLIGRFNVANLYIYSWLPKDYLSGEWESKWNLPEGLRPKKNEFYFSILFGLLETELDQLRTWLRSDEPTDAVQLFATLLAEQRDKVWLETFTPYLYPKFSFGLVRAFKEARVTQEEAENYRGLPVEWVRGVLNLPADPPREWGPGF